MGLKETEEVTAQFTMALGMVIGGLMREDVQEYLKKMGTSWAEMDNLRVAALRVADAFYTGVRAAQEKEGT